MRALRKFMNDPAVLLENEYLSAVILPKRGGKTASLICRETGMELLQQNKFGAFRDAEFGSDFGQFEACGFDDAFPNVDAETIVYEGRELRYPDHGEIWSAQMEAAEDGEQENSVTLRFASGRFSYEYRKRIELSGRELRCSYTIRNTGGRDLPCIWTMHCLVNVTPQMRFVFPESVRLVRNVFASKQLGETEGLYSFPEAVSEGRVRRLDRLPEVGMMKFYVEGKCPAGECGYDFPETDTRLRILYDPEKLPYLGLWVTNGGYRGDKNAALEPATGFYDSISKAQRLSGETPLLPAGRTLEFSICLRAERLAR